MPGELLVSTLNPEGLLPIGANAASTLKEVGVLAVAVVGGSFARSALHSAKGGSHGDNNVKEGRIRRVLPGEIGLPERNGKLYVSRAAEDEKGGLLHDDEGNLIWEREFKKGFFLA